MKKLLLLFVVTLMSVMATAYDLSDNNGLHYNIKGDGTLEVVGLESEKRTADILSDVTINGNTYQVTSIGAYAFEGRSDITYLSIPWSVKSIGEYAFIDCGSSITVNIADPESWCQMKLGNEHSSPLSSAGKVLVHDIETTNIDIPEGVTSIGNFTFYQCRSIISLNIPSTVKSIGSSAFEDCTGLTSLTLSVGLQSIGGSAFQGCTGLTSLSIPSTVTTISINAFANCTGITDVYCYTEDVPNTDSDAFDSTPIEKSTLHVSANAVDAYKTTWPWSDFKDTLPIVIIYDHILKVPDFYSGGFPFVINGNSVYVTRGGPDRGNIEIPSQVTYNGISYSVTAIGYEAFAENHYITSVKIPNTVTSIDSYAFDNCRGLNTITIPNSVTRIGNWAFFGCRSMTSLIIPNSVSHIGKGAFVSCKGLTSIVSEIKNPFEIGDDVFADDIKDIYATATLIVPAGRKEAYQTTAGWNKFQNIVEGTYDNPQKLTIHVPVAGMLPYLISEDQKYQIEDLTLTGELNGTDIRFIRDMSGINYQKRPNCMTFCDYQSFSTPGILKVLDITNANIVSGGDCYYAWTKNRTDDIHDEYYTVTNSVTRNLFYKLQSIKLPNSVTSIGDWAFSGCSGLTSITIGNSVTSIGFRAFESCSDLTSITIPNSVTTIGSSAFYGTGWYNNQPDGLVYAGKVAYKYKGTMPDNTSITIKEGTVGIAENAFSGCSGLTFITIPNSVTSIGWGAFQNCMGLTSISVESGNEKYDSRDNCNGIIETGTNTLVYGCKNTIIPNSVTSIGKSAFSGCSGMTSITIPNSVTSIGDYAFYDCSGLTSITIPNSVMTIGSSAFYGCSGLTTIVTEIENPFEIEPYVFGSSYTTATLIVPKGTKAAYQSTEGWNKFQNIIEADEITENDVNYTIEGETAVVSMSTSVKGELKIEESVEIDGKTYQVTAIASGAFQGNVEITSVVIPNSIETIGASAFEGCTGISTIIIGKAVKEIASRAFAEIFSNKTGTRAEGFGIDVYCYAEEVPNTGGDAFDGTPTELSTLHVPLSAIEKYKTSWPWSDFKEIVPLANSSFIQNGINYAVKDDGTLEVTGIEDGTTIVDLLSDVYIDGNTYQVTSIGAYAFEGRSDITYLSIPWSVTSIGEYAFIDCGSNLTVNIADPESWCQMKLGNEHSSPLSSARKVLVHDIETTSIDIPEGVISIGNFTFYQCRSIISLNIPSTVKSIGSSAFEDCTGLTSLTLSEGLQSIGGSAFQGCTGLQFLTIPRTVKSIYINAFANCKGITDVYCYAEGVPNTDSDAFDSTPTEKSTLHVPANAVEAYRTTWPWSDFKDIVSLASEDPNGIVEVKQFDDCKGLYYDIYGRRIHQVRHKGLYIQNGKKIVVK